MKLKLNYSTFEQGVNNVQLQKVGGGKEDILTIHQYTSDFMNILSHSMCSFHVALHIRNAKNANKSTGYATVHK